MGSSTPRIMASPRSAIVSSSLGAATGSSGAIAGHSSRTPSIGSCLLPTRAPALTHSVGGAHWETQSAHSGRRILNSCHTLPRGRLSSIWYRLERTGGTCGTASVTSISGASWAELTRRTAGKSAFGGAWTSTGHARPCQRVLYKRGRRYAIPKRLGPCRCANTHAFNSSRIRINSLVQLPPSTDRLGTQCPSDWVKPWGAR